ncbi:MAG: glycosyltransferase [Ignavibacteria bacterium]
MTGTEISVIIPFRGNKEELSKCLDGLRNQDSDILFEIIVVESGINPEVKQLVASVPNSVLISCKSIMYPGKARNQGIENSKSALLAFMDADCIPLSNWINEIHASLKSGNKIVIGPVIDLYPFHPVASIDNLLQFPDFRKYRLNKIFTHFPACNLGINKELVYKSGKFPEEIITGEDVIFSQSAIRNNGGKVYFNRNLIVRHSGRKDFKSFIEHNRSLGFHRGYLNLKISKFSNKNRDSFLFALIFGIKRLIYISIRTLQWNPVSLFSMIFYFPFVILGLSAWVEGFRRGNKKYLEEKIAV